MEVGTPQILGAPGLCEAKWVYFSWKPKCQLFAVLTMMPCATSALCYWPGSFWCIISPLGTKLPFPQCQPNVFQTQNMQSQISESNDQVNDQVWKKHYLFLSSDKTPRIKKTLKQEHSWAYTGVKKKNQSIFFFCSISHPDVSQHFTTQWSFQCIYRVCKYCVSLRDVKPEKRKEGVSSPYRNYFSQQSWVSVI